MDKDDLIRAQNDDVTLQECFKELQRKGQTDDVGFCVEKVY